MTDARLTRVVRYNKAQHSIIDRDFVHAQTIPFDLPGPQVAASDGNLLVSRIAIESNHFHTIQEWSWNGFGHVRCCNEQNMREVEFDIQVMILERMILRRIEHFEKRRRGITAPIGAELVDLVEHDHGIHCTGVAQCAHEPAGQGSDVRASMTADLGLIANATQRHPDKLSSCCPRDGFANGRLSGSRGPDQRQNRSRSPVIDQAALRAQLANRKIFGNAPFNIVQTRMVGIQHLPRVLWVQTLFRPFGPWHSEQPVEIRTDHGCLGVRLPHLVQAREFTFGLFLNRLRHPGVGNLLPVLLDNGAFVFTEFLANRVHLPAQKIFALLLLSSRLHLVSNAPAHVQFRKPLLLKPQRKL